MARSHAKVDRARTYAARLGAHAAEIRARLSAASGHKVAAAIGTAEPDASDLGPLRGELVTVERMDAIERGMARKPPAAAKVEKQAEAERLAVAGMQLHGMQAIADFLGVSRSAAYHLAASRQIPTFKMGATVCAERADLTAAIKARSLVAEAHE